MFVLAEPSTGHHRHDHPRPLTIVIGMPKTGTETINAFFACNGWKHSHQHCVTRQHGTSTTRTYCGKCMTNWVVAMSGSNIADGHAALRSTCGDFDVFSQVDWEPFGACMFPQVFYLHTLLRYLPHACFILNTRPTAHWLRSVRGFGNMMPRLIESCPVSPQNETGLGDWYDGHKARASVALRSARCSLEFDIEDGVGLTTHLDRFFKLNSSAKCLDLLIKTEKKEVSSRTRS